MIGEDMREMVFLNDLLEPCFIEFTYGDHLDVFESMDVRIVGALTPSARADKSCSEHRIASAE